MNTLFRALEKFVVVDRLMSKLGRPIFEVAEQDGEDMKTFSSNIYSNDRAEHGGFMLYWLLTEYEPDMWDFTFFAGIEKDSIVSIKYDEVSGWSILVQDESKGKQGGRWSTIVGAHAKRESVFVAALERLASEGDAKMKALAAFKKSVVGSVSLTNITEAQALELIVCLAKELIDLFDMVARSKVGGVS